VTDPFQQRGSVFREAGRTVGPSRKRHEKSAVICSTGKKGNFEGLARRSRDCAGDMAGGGRKGTSVVRREKKKTKGKKIRLSTLRRDEGSRKKIGVSCKRGENIAYLKNDFADEGISAEFRSRKKMHRKEGRRGSGYILGILPKTYELAEKVSFIRTTVSVGGSIKLFGEESAAIVDKRKRHRRRKGKRRGGLEKSGGV